MFSEVRLHGLPGGLRETLEEKGCEHKRRGKEKKKKKFTRRNFDRQDEGDPDHWEGSLVGPILANQRCICHGTKANLSHFSRLTDNGRGALHSGSFPIRCSAQRWLNGSSKRCQGGSSRLSMRSNSLPLSERMHVSKVGHLSTRVPQLCGESFFCLDNSPMRAPQPSIRPHSFPTSFKTSGYPIPYP